MHRLFRKDVMSLIPGQRFVHVDITTTTSGAVSGTTATGYGVKATKTASEVGRYTLQLCDSQGNAQDAIGYCNAIVTIEGADDAAFTDAKGVWEGKVRDNDIGQGAKDGTIEIQFCDADSGADAEVQDGAILHVTLILRDSDSY